MPRICIDEEISIYSMPLNIDFELLQIRSGTGTFYVGDHTGNYGEGDLFLLAGGLPRNFSTGRHNKFSATRVLFNKMDVFDQEESSAINDRLKLSGFGIRIWGVSSQHISIKIRELQVSVLTEKYLHFHELLVLLSSAGDYAFLSSKPVKSYAESQETGKRKIDYIYDFMLEHFREELMLEDIARHFGMKKAAFCRYFKRWTGNTYTDKLCALRVMLAKEKLMEGQMNITEICFHSGFGNLSYFNKRFKEIAGVSPRQYKNSTRKTVFV